MLNIGLSPLKVFKFMILSRQSLLNVESSASKNTVSPDDYYITMQFTYCDKMLLKNISSLKNFLKVLKNGDTEALAQSHYQVKKSL